MESKVPHGALDSTAYHGRRSQSIAVNKRRRRQLDWEDTRKPAWVAWLSGLCTIALLLALLALGSSNGASTMMVNGDRLGPYDMSRAQYQRHAEQVLAETAGEEARWALVLAKQPWTPNILARILGEVERGGDRIRVSTLYAAGVGLQAESISEPAAGHTREDVFTDAALMQAGGDPEAARQVRFDGMLVYAKPEQLRGLAAHVFAVEPAPADAVYGKIGVRTQALAE
ncbi:hypothetical protein [Corynebacterium resistens]|uniref:hypothetical protein n=1 Tax=Corynebacterium resistens TaxID=258224 RepID=UPI0023527870|nr:hypothetical protein [Corynebacterium resistens]